MLLVRKYATGRWISGTQNSVDVSLKKKIGQHYKYSKIIRQGGIPQASYRLSILPTYLPSATPPNAARKPTDNTEAYKNTRRQANEASKYQHCCYHKENLKAYPNTSSWLFKSASIPLTATSISTLVFWVCIRSARIRSPLIAPANGFRRSFS